jgi:hypothetical protein
MNERGFPHLVELELLLSGFRNCAHAWYEYHDLAPVGATRRLGFRLHSSRPTTRASPTARAAPTTEFPNSSSKIHGCANW